MSIGILLEQRLNYGVNYYEVRFHSLQLVHLIFSSHLYILLPLTTMNLIET